MGTVQNKVVDTSPQEEEYYNLGSFHRLITTTNPSTQTWFNRGLIWTYAFNHGEAAQCFSQAISLDSSCAMAYWGLAYCMGPNYNKPWSVFDSEEIGSSVARTHEAASQAKEHSANASLVERAIIEALQFRYPEEIPGSDLSIWNQKYADAMEVVYSKFPEDLDVCALFADALMNLTPWQLWDLPSGQPAPGARTLEAKFVLETAFLSPEGQKHPGLLHLYIHLTEMSPSPESALPLANNLRGLVPDSGHLSHMPTHLDIRCGDYQSAITSNTDAIRADSKFVSRAGPLNFYTLYRCHNYHFLIYAAMFSGQSSIALSTVSALESNIPSDLLKVKSPPMADWLESFLSVRIHVLIRFGLWNQLLALPLPLDSELYCVTTAMIHYGKGIAYASTSHIPEAEEQQNLFEEAVLRVPSSRTLFNNTSLSILAIASAMLAAEILYRRHNYDLAFSHLENAVKLDDGLPYDEPWGWMQPTRHAYGALLLEQGRVGEACRVYEADLGVSDELPMALRHPNNVWALQGYHECLVKLGRSEEARVLEGRLREAVKGADVEVKASCFCRLGKEG